ncbi:hypothetical protein, partial [Thiomicrospira microaerophila]|uniref:hypothetical protein n=1 Tax=Thiomicrospira microaerophila TaxID=406020 RepID=UPI0005CAA682
MLQLKKRLSITLLCAGLVLWNAPVLSSDDLTKLTRGGFSFEIAKKDGKINLDDEGVFKVNINTTRRLHYGMLPADKLNKLNKEDIAFKDWFGLAISDTKMLKPQQGFFAFNNIGKLANFSGLQNTCQDGVVTTCTAFEVGQKDQSKDIVAGNEYYLYTDFDSLSMPSIMNYATLVSIAVDLATQPLIVTNERTRGQDLREKAQKSMINGDVFDYIYNHANLSLTTAKILTNLIELYLHAEGSEPSFPIKKPAQSELGVMVLDIKESFKTIEEALKALSTVKKQAIANTVTDGSLRKITYSEDKTNALVSAQLNESTGSKKSSTGAFSADYTIEDMLTYAMLQALLNRFTDKNSTTGKEYFYFPKNPQDKVNYFVSAYKAAGVSYNKNTNYLKADLDQAEISEVMKVYKKLIEKEKLDQKEQLIAQSMVFAIGVNLFTNTGSKAIKFLSSTKELEKALKAIDKGELVSASGKMLMKGFLTQVDNIGQDFLQSILTRVATYAVPGIGWGRAAVDLANAGNQVAPFAYDIFTAPRRIPFLVEQEGVYAPFSVAFDKYSFLRYPGIQHNGAQDKQEVNSVDPFSNGQYAYSHYFLYGEHPLNQFQPWNINNRNATLAASGVAYSYDVIAAARGESGKEAMTAIHQQKDNFDDGLYGIQFHVARHEHDDPYSTGRTFTSPLTGITNQTNEVLEENYLIDVLGIQIKNKTQYHLNQMARATPTDNWIHKPFKADDSKQSTPNSVIDYLAKDKQFENQGLYYISFADGFASAIETKYKHGAIVNNYKTDKGIVHVTPGIYTIDAQLEIIPPTSAKVKGNTVFSDNHKMFVMANVSNGLDTALEKDPNVIPYIAINQTPNTSTAIGRRFEYNPNQGSYHFAFKLHRPNNTPLFVQDYDRKIRIAFFLRDLSTENHTEHFFYTLDPNQTKPDQDGVYRIQLPAHFFIKQEEGKHFANAGLRLAWYDSVMTQYANYVGVDEADIVDELFKRNSQTSQTYDAVNKIFMAQYTFDGHPADANFALDQIGAPVTQLKTLPDIEAVHPSNAQVLNLMDTRAFKWSHSTDFAYYELQIWGTNANAFTQTLPAQRVNAYCKDETCVYPFNELDTELVEGTLLWRVQGYGHGINGVKTTDIERFTLTRRWLELKTDDPLKTQWDAFTGAGHFKEGEYIQFCFGNLHSENNQETLIGYLIEAKNLSTNETFLMLGESHNPQTGCSEFNLPQTGKIKLQRLASEVEYYGEPELVSYGLLNPENIRVIAKDASGESGVDEGDSTEGSTETEKRKIAYTQVLESYRDSTGQWISTFYTNGHVYANLHFRSGTLDLAGRTLIIEGDLIHSGGTLNINGGQLIVKGDYRI